MASYTGFDIETRPEPAGRGWQSCLAGHPGHWSRGDTEDEAIGSLVRRLNVQAGGLPPEARKTADLERQRDELAAENAKLRVGIIPGTLTDYRARIEKQRNALADALEDIHRRMDRWAVGNVQPGLKGKDSDMPLLRERIKAALRAAGRLP